MVSYWTITGYNGRIIDGTKLNEIIELNLHIVIFDKGRIKFRRKFKVELCKIFPI